MGRRKLAVCASSVCFPALVIACLPSCACLSNSTGVKRPICAARSTPLAPTKTFTWPPTAGSQPSPTRSNGPTRSLPWLKRSSKNRLLGIADLPIPPRSTLPLHTRVIESIWKRHILRLQSIYPGGHWKPNDCSNHYSRRSAAYPEKRHHNDPQDPARHPT